MMIDGFVTCFHRARLPVAAPLAIGETVVEVPVLYVPSTLLIEGIRPYALYHRNAMQRLQRYM